jgi:transposase
MLTPEEKNEIQRLFRQQIPLRAIARRLGRDPKTIRQALRAQGLQPSTSATAGCSPSATAPANTESRTATKLEPYHELVKALHAKGLRSPRIHREIRERGYAGGRSILKSFLKSLQPPKSPKPRTFRRFETAPGQEAQSDWSPYRVQIAGVLTVVHAFSLILCFCRRLFIALFRDERLATLLFAHQEAFRYHQGICQRIVYDNQTAITLGRLNGKPLWHPTFLDFAKHYGFAPLVGKPRHKERRGKVERPFDYFEHDFLPDRHFASWEDLNQQCRHWLDTVANVRPHGTTRRRVDEAFAQEQPCLISLPAVGYPAARIETRIVQKDGYIPVDGSYYPVPDALVKEGPVSVRIDPRHVQILDRHGHTVASYPVPEKPTRISAPESTPPVHRPPVSRPVQEAAFLARFPQAQAFLDGLRGRMNTLSPIHLRAIDRLVDLYGLQAVQDAIAHATAYRNWNAHALQRILEQRFPAVVPEPDPRTLCARPEALAALDDVESGSPRDYSLDQRPPSTNLSNDQGEQTHGAES